jgi:uncharacterized membrane protein SirB2
MPILKFLHILAMFSAVTLIFGGVVFLEYVARTRDVTTYRRLYEIWERTDTPAIILFVAGIVFGLLTAITGGFDPTASWLILAYVIVVAIVVDGFLFTGRWYNRIKEAASLSNPEQAADEVRRLIGTPRHIGALAISTALWASIIFVMVVKPSLF